MHSSLYLTGALILFKHEAVTNTVDQRRWDLQEYQRKLKFSLYFQDGPDSNPPPFTPKSNWTPVDSKVPTVISDLIKADITYFNTAFGVALLKPNLLPSEVKALKCLCSNKHILMKPADKGSSAVIMDRTQYLWEGYRQLNDNNYYTN